MSNCGIASPCHILLVAGLIKRESIKQPIYNRKDLFKVINRQHSLIIHSSIVNRHSNSLFKHKGFNHRHNLTGIKSLEMNGTGSA